MKTMTGKIVQLLGQDAMIEVTPPKDLKVGDVVLVKATVTQLRDQDGDIVLNLRRNCGLGNTWVVRDGIVARVEEEKACDHDYWTATRKCLKCGAEKPEEKGKIEPLPSEYVYEKGNLDDAMSRVWRKLDEIIERLNR